MSVNIFGSGGRGSNLDKKYVDSKFITLTRILETKLDKSGGVLTGDIDVNKYRVLNVNNPQDITDAINMDYVSKLIKQQQAQIESVCDNKYNIATSDDSGWLKIENRFHLRLDPNPKNSLSLTTNGLVSSWLICP